MISTDEPTQHDLHYLKMAFVVASMSKCVRAHYGSILVSADGRIVSTGRNGKPRGSINDDVCYRLGVQPNANNIPDCCLHSEANCLMFASPEEKEGATLYVSGVPCENCTLLIAQSKIARLVYYIGTQESGHRGDFDYEFYQKYGMTFELVPVSSL